MTALAILHDMLFPPFPPLSARAAGGLASDLACPDAHLPLFVPLPCPAVPAELPQRTANHGFG
jgi:hypothetical protein